MFCINNKKHVMLRFYLYKLKIKPIMNYIEKPFLMIQKVYNSKTNNI